VHEREDDLGRGNETDSKTTGHAGPRYGCCIVIETTPSTSGDFPVLSIDESTKWRLFQYVFVIGIVAQDGMV